MDEAFSTIVVIQLARLYDLQLAMLSLIDPNLATHIEDLHSSGEFFGPEPALAVPGESGDISVD